VSRRRIVPALVAAALAVTVLAGCKSNVGVAARVSGTTISESDVNKYVSPKGVASSAAAQGGDQAPSPRSEILHFLIQEQVFQKTLRHQGIRPSAGDLAAQHDAAAATLLNTQLTGADLDKTLDRQLPRSGVRASFRNTFLRVQELEYLLIKNGRLTQFSQLLALVRKAGIKVSVSPRYGSWDEANLQLKGTSPLPSFVSAQPAAGGS
jgi:hypothetical protein